MLIIKLSWAIIWTSLLLFLMVWLLDAFWTEEDIKDKDGFALVAIIGCLGGFARWLHDMGKDIKYALSYRSCIDLLISPLKSAVLAVIVAYALKGGVLALGAKGSDGNWEFLYGIAGFVGLFAPQTFIWLENAFRSKANEKVPPSDND
ncbi:hypothetical protein [Cerasicoccus frondis]|uniref:hypothetical protein n=1 Tax=Cerasicoccus frondis TaxID=490090 RepID=UPI002852D75A|nr:hypothetical protein [Cerasicoccus frondis]